MAFPASIRAKVSCALRANNEHWSGTSWARKLALVQAEAVSSPTPELPPDEAAMARCTPIALYALQQRIIRFPHRIILTR